MRSRAFHWALVALAALAVGSITGVARGDVTVTPTDFNSLLSNLGPLAAGPLDTDFVTPPPLSTNVGTLRAEVYHNTSNNVYTYVYQIRPSAPIVQTFSTGFMINNDFNGVAGYNFGESLVAGGAGTANDFGIVYNSANQLVFTTRGNWFGRNDVVTFFFQLAGAAPASTPQPSVNITDSTNTTASSNTIIPNTSTPATITTGSDVTAIPEPAGFSLLALGGLGMLRRRR